MFTGAAQLVPIHIAGFVTHASSEQLAFLRHMIDTQLFTRDRQIASSSSGGAPVLVQEESKPSSSVWGTPNGSRSPLFSASSDEKKETPRIVTPREPVPVPEQEPNVDKCKLYIERPTGDCDWDYYEFRMEVLRAMEHKSIISKIYCPKEGADFVTVDFNESSNNPKKNAALALDALKKLKVKKFQVSYCKKDE